MLVGVAMPNMMEAMVGALASRHVTSAWVVHGHGGLDELAVSGPNIVYELRDDNISRFEIDAAEFGIAHSTLADIRGGDATDNLAIMNGLFGGQTGAVRDIVTFNAGCALFVAKHVESVADGIDVARATIDSGSAASMLAAVVAVSSAEAERMQV
jgi:anthranilate phosphoribosyltransferase